MKASSYLQKGDNKMAQPARYTADVIAEYVEKGYWDDKTMVDVLHHNVKKFPDKEAVVDSHRRMTWSEVGRMSESLACGFLELGIGKDEVIVVQLPNWVENFVLRFALQEAGILGCFAQMTYRYVEMEHILGGLGAVGAIIPAEFHGFSHLHMIDELKSKVPSLKHVIVVRDEARKGTIPLRDLNACRNKSDAKADQRIRGFNAFEVTMLHPTSGTTGLPKFCEWPNSIIRATGRCVCERLRLTKSDVCGAFAPLSGGPGVMVWAVAPQIPAKTVLLEDYEAQDIFKVIEQERVSFVSTSPAVLNRMLEHPATDKYDLSSLRVIRSGAAPLFAHVAAEIEKRFRCRIAPASGSAEVLLRTQTAIDQSDEERHTTAGKPATGNEVKIVDEYGEIVPVGVAGEMLVRGACAGSGYYRDKDATYEAWGPIGSGGWIHSGDLVKADEQGNISYVGRKKDVIIRGAQNIYPAEIETILLLHPSIFDVAIVGMPDPIMGEKACAYVILRDKEELTLEEMSSYLRKQRLASFKIPERLEVVNHFPTVAEGHKVNKRALAEDIGKKLSAEGRL